MEGQEDDPQRRRPDIERAEKELGWKPVVSCNLNFNFVPLIFQFYSRQHILFVSAVKNFQVPLLVGLSKTIEYFRKELTKSESTKDL